MKKGFTLAELMGVVVILAAIALIIIPVVDKQLKEGKQDLYNDTLNSIKSSLDLYMADKSLEENESMVITLYQLKQAGYIDVDVKNPLTEELLPNDMLLTILNDDGILKYSIDDKSGENKIEYDKVSHLSLYGNVIEYIELGEEYKELGICNGISTDICYEDPSKMIDVTTDAKTTMDSNLDVTKVGTYKIGYIYTENGHSNKIIRTVIVRDTKGPTIDFQTLYIPLSEAENYDYTSDIKTSDLSGDVTVTVSDPKEVFKGIPGTYSIKYIAKDIYGNQTVKYRKVVTS